MNLTSQLHHPSASPRSTIHLYILCFLFSSLAFFTFFSLDKVNSGWFFMPSAVPYTLHHLRDVQTCYSR